MLKSQNTFKKVSNNTRQKLKKLPMYPLTFSYPLSVLSFIAESFRLPELSSFTNKS